MNFSSKAKDIVAFLHAAFYSPALSTLRQALKRNYITIPGLILQNLAAYPPPITATTKGHLDQVRKNKKTSSAPLPADDTDDTDLNPPQEKKTGYMHLPRMPPPRYRASIF